VKSDFNGDRKADILWQNTSTGQRVISLMNGTVIQSVVDLGTVPTSWSIAGSSDFNGDGKADILWQNTSTGQCVISLMNGTVIQSVVDLGTVPTSWSIRNY
jgi:23S rRNA U2552 (ribose-2'-O)-methylase RlmE/FtsJ